MNLNKTIRKILAGYEAKGLVFGIKNKVDPLPGDRYRLNIQVLPETRVADIMRHAEDVRLSAKLEILEPHVDGKDVYIIFSKELESVKCGLFSILRSEEYIEASQNTELSFPVGVDQIGTPVIVDLMNPQTFHMLVSGTTGSGKTVFLKCLLITLAMKYAPTKLCLLIGDKANDLSQFADIPQLSCPIIEDFTTFLGVLSILKDEMDRRISAKHTPKFKKLPIIVCVIDEFNSFMNEAQDKSDIILAKDTLSQLLRRGRHAKIHFVLSAHNPTKNNMYIDTSDLLVKVAFRVSNYYNSVTILGKGGAEKLKGEGDMMFNGNGTVQHLQGPFISDSRLNDTVNNVRKYYGGDIILSPKHYTSARL